MFPRAAGVHQGALALVLGAGLVAGCGGNGGDDAADTTTTGAETTTTTVGTTTTTGGDGAIDAAALFTQNCATCHGEAGQGSGIGPDLRPVTDPSVSITAMMEGPGAMPSFADVLDDEEMQALADHVVDDIT